ncbi:hemolysin D [Myxococcus xanthus]|uniref:Hemolysin D n=1 Tax=Myxococcus xanthus TaxID=34 RepID=A0A7Y4ICX3_MYXXA|nr:hemolysin D [Myxococcus xanthus]NOJ76791.1 hemolysin D [Myxococcus xanthus]NOJ84250.1 hemolysin D [Myxococcus xanthus]
MNMKTLLVWRPRLGGRAIALGLSLSALAGLGVVPREAAGFTQSGAGVAFGNGIPMGHEWITRLAVLELIGGDPIMQPDPKDPRKGWTKGKAKNTNLSSPEAQRELNRIRSSKYADQRYQSTYKAVYDAIVGERWVDIAGFNVTNGQMGKYNCFDAVAQEPVEVQYDHFMRRYDDRDANGGVKAAKESRSRFVKYFVDAAMAPPSIMRVWDGGGYSAQTDVDRNYFLFGRAAHLFEDSFSSEHVVRIPADNYERVRQVKSYLCASGAEQHSHSMKDVLSYQSGDAIWLPGTQLETGWSAYKPSFMKTQALVATEATKDLWAAFIRTMGTPMSKRKQVAEAEANRLADNWMGMDEAEARAWYNDERRRDSTYVLASGQTGKGQSVSACMKGLGVGSGNQLDKVKELEETQRICLYNVEAEPGYADLFDPSVRMPFNWRWKSSTWQMPPKDWKIPERAADTGKRVRIKSVSNGQYMSAPDGVAHNQWLYCRANSTPLDFILVGSQSDGFYRVASSPGLFMSYTTSTGAVKLWNSPTQANYKLESSSTGHAIKSLYWNQYMWLSKESPYITKAGDPKARSAWWAVEGL